MTTLDTVVVGAGHAGLAVSRLLTDAGRDHVVLDRGRVGERWRTERWDSLHLLTPAWMTRLPGGGYTGPDPDGYLSAASSSACSRVRLLVRGARRLRRHRALRDGRRLGGAPLPHRHHGRHLARPARRRGHRAARDAERAGGRRRA